MEVENLTRLFR